MILLRTTISKGVSCLEVCVPQYASVILINSFPPLLSGLVNFLSLSGLVVVLVLLISLVVLLLSTAFGCGTKILSGNGDVIGTTIIGICRRG